MPTKDNPKDHEKNLGLFIVALAFSLTTTCVLQADQNLKDAQAKKLTSIQLPDLNWDHIKMADAIQKLQQLSKANDPEKVGVNFVVRKYNDPDPVITLQLKHPTLGQALDQIEKQTGYKLTVEDYALYLKKSA